MEVVSCEFCDIGFTSKYKRQMCADVSRERYFCVYINQTYCNSKKTYLLQMLKSFHNVIEDQKCYYSDSIHTTFH